MRRRTYFRLVSTNLGLKTQDVENSYGSKKFGVTDPLQDQQNFWVGHMSEILLSKKRRVKSTKTFRMFAYNVEGLFL